ncbi:transposase [Candidatus Poribacteria bacterium]|nr:transposase [Candidatus Poribacteria bacterium]
MTCPQGNTPKDWIPTTDANGNPTIRIRFARSTCSGYEVLSLCTRATKDGRSLTLRANQAQHQVLREARQQQQTPQWKKRYAKRAGVEGTLSQEIRAFGLRQARYIGRPKTHLQHILTATAINLVRADAWLTGTPLAKTRISRFLALQPMAA